MMSLRSLGALARGLATAAFALTAVATPRPAQAQWTTTYEQFYLQAPHNWTFRNQYASADRLFNAFDYGHAILYETLWTKPNASASRLEVKEFDFLTRTVLVKPPRVPLEEAAILANEHDPRVAAKQDGIAWDHDHRLALHLRYDSRKHVRPQPRIDLCEVACHLDGSAARVN